MKRVGKIVLMGVCLGIVLLIVQRSLGISEKNFMRWYWILGGVAIVLAVLGNIGYNISYQMKMKKIMPLLSENPAEYNKKVELLLKHAKGKTLRKILGLNLSAGYLETKQYEKSRDLLEKIGVDELRNREFQLVHAINSCECYFQLEEFEKAQDLYEKNQELFQENRNHPAYGGCIAILDIIAAISAKDYQQARELLEDARINYPETRIQKTLEKVESFLEKNRK